MSRKGADGFRDVSHFASQPIDVEIAGKTYQVSPLGLADFFALEDHIKSRRISAYLESAQVQSLPEEERQAGIQAILRSQVRADEVSQTPAGGVWLCWRSLSKCHPKITLDDVGRLVTEKGSLIDIVMTLSEGERPNAEETPPQGEGGPTGSASSVPTTGSP